MISVDNVRGKIIFWLAIIGLLFTNLAFAKEMTDPEIINIELECGTDAHDDFKTYAIDLEIPDAAVMTSSDPAVAYVDDNGLIHGRAPGRANISIDTPHLNNRVYAVEVFLLGQEETPQAPIYMRNAYIYGYPDGSFKPDQAVSRGQVALMLTRALNLERPTVAIAYDDVDPNAWYYPGVQAVSQAGLMMGANKAFRPDGLVTKAEMARIFDLYFKTSDVLLTPEEMVFDVQDDHWAKLSIYKMIQEGVLALKDPGVFGPEDYFLRHEMVLLLNKNLGWAPYEAGVVDFIDVSDEEVYVDALKAAAQSHLED